MPQLTLEKQPQTQNTTVTSQLDNEMVNAIRNNRIVQIPWAELTQAEKRAAHVAIYHQGWW